MRATSPTPGSADAELRRAINFVIRGSELEETLIVGGDFNILPEASTTVAGADQRPARVALAAGRDRDRPVPASAARSRRRVEVWPDERRELNRRLLSDHAPVEIEIELRPKD